MNKQTSQAIFSVLLILLVAFALTLAGSYSGQRLGRFPIFALCVLLAFLINWAAYIPSFLNQTERYYDLVGAISNTAVVSSALFLSRDLSARDWLLWGLILIWAGRLGYFLFRRVRQSGSDSRFDAIKRSAPRFWVAWSLQALWTVFTQAAALAAMTGMEKRPFGLLAALGLLLWLAGFIIEVVADRQKSQFRQQPANQGQFIQSGLWAWSRHPNYFGEIVLWLGIALIALPALQGWQWVTLLSPIFVIVLLTRISGVPLLEAKADKKWGGEPAYEAYKARTPLLMPRPPEER